MTRLSGKGCTAPRRKTYDRVLDRINTQVLQLFVFEQRGTWLPSRHGKKMNGTSKSPPPASILGFLLFEHAAKTYTKTILNHCSSWSVSNAAGGAFVLWGIQSGEDKRERPCARVLLVNGGWRKRGLVCTAWHQQFSPSAPVRCVTLSFGYPRPSPTCRM